MRARPLLLALATGLFTVASAVWAPAAYAAGTADLTVLVSGPASATTASPFTETIVITNHGPDAADGATFVVVPPSGSSGIAASCTAASGAATCPASVVVAPGSVSGTVPTLPANGAVTLVMTGQYGTGPSAAFSATVTSPVGVMDPDPASNASTHTTALWGRTADVSVSTSMDISAAAFGQTITYTTTIANNGPDDLVGLHLENHFHSLNVGAQNGLNVTGSLSCGASAANAAPCPASLAAPVPYTGVLTGADLPIGWPSVDIPAGRTLYLKVSVAFATSHCGTFDVRQVVDAVHLVAPTGTTLTGTSSAVSPQVTLGPCTDVAIDVAMSSQTPRAGQPVTTTVTVSNSAAAALSDVPFVIQLPDRGGLTVDPAKVPPVCTLGSAAVACPQDLTYDVAKRTITGTVASIAGGDRFSLSLAGTAGVVPATGYAITASIPHHGHDVASTSAVMYQIANSRAKISASFTLQGGVSTRALAFAGTVTCALQGTVPFSVTIPAGQTRATAALSASIWLGDECKAAVTSIPAAPEGYVWAGRGGAQVDVSSANGVRAGAFTFVLRSAPSAPALAVPSTSGTDAGVPTPVLTAMPADADTSASTPSVKDVITVVTGATDSSTDWFLAAVGALVTLVGVGLASGRL